MEDLLNCPICCIGYDTTSRIPRQLPCQHNLCSSCLPHMKKTSNQQTFIECPICREKFTRNIEDIPRSLVIVQLIDARQGTSHSVTTAPSQPSSEHYSSPAAAAAAAVPYPQIPPYNQIQPPPPPPYYHPTNPFIDSFNSTYSQPAPPAPAYQPVYPSQYPNYQPNGQPAYNSNFYPTQLPTYPPHYEKTAAPPHRPPSPVRPAPAPRPPQPQNHSSSTNNNNNQPWSFRNYLLGIFSEIDSNRDGSITAVELQRALRRCQSTEFDMKTIELLIAKYDTNSDRQISFDEFFDLFNNLNEEYESFLLTDVDGSGFIDLHEFSEALRIKGYSFPRGFYEYIVNKICKRTKQSGIQFDIYIRVAARFDQLCQEYNRTIYDQRSSLENFLRNKFFDNFW